MLCDVHCTGADLSLAILLTAQTVTSAESPSTLRQRLKCIFSHNHFLTVSWTLANPSLVVL